MSMTALRWVRDVDPGVGLAAKAVLRDLADRANDSGVCWPSRNTIAADTGMSRRSVTRALQKLEAEELLKIKRIPGRGSRYVLTVPLSGDVTDCHTPGDKLAPPGDTLSPKASISLSEAKPWATPAEKTRENAGAYRKADLDLPDVEVTQDALDIIEQARRRLKRKP